ncbi:MAG TPA: c(7)-type cytochrome triheme domain-containing protein [Desulfuromonadaceae bacterium]
MKNVSTIIAAVLITAAAAVAAENHGGDVVYTKPVKSVLFSHKVHVEDKELSCDLCHARTFQMQALSAQENPDFTMKSLVEGKYCGTCHNGTMAFASNTRCTACHTGVKGAGGGQASH